MKHKRNGFTIVELIIVIVVIAILASLSVVSYAAISDRARDTAITTEMTRASQELATYTIANQNKYPSSLSQIGFTPSNEVTLIYTRGAGAKSYLMIGTKNGASYSLSSTDISPQRQ